jgi:hypothetical protein
MFRRSITSGLEGGDKEEGAGTHALLAGKS